MVVVGGGPAGSMAAKTAAEKGASVLLLERDPNIGVPVRCGEGINLTNLEKLVGIDDRWISVRIEGLIVYAPDGTPVQIHGLNEIGAILERSVFDRYLAELAGSAGAHIQTRSDVDGLVKENGKVTGVYYTRFGKRRKISADVVIGADGVESRIGRWAGIKTSISAGDLESAYQKVLTGIEYDHRFCHFYLGRDISPGGYIWIFPKGEKTASVGMGVEARLGGAGMAYRLLDSFIKRRFGNPAVVGEMAGGVPCARPLKRPASDGILLAGDAARHCNPLTGGGIYTAIVAGRHAGQVAAEAIGKGDVSAKELLKAYNSLLDDDIIKPHYRSYKIAKGGKKLTDEMMNKTASEVLKLPVKDRTMRKIFLKGLISQPKLTMDVIKAFV